MRSRSRHRFFPRLGLFGLCVLLYAATASAKREHLVYFPNTAYELNIYKIHGKNPGKTLMLIGGIQGNEPGGFLSADLYADMRLQKGNLIVVPRANFYSIITDQRDPHGDMNRKFTPVDITDSMEDKIVTILKALIKESDYLLNLHDGSGYYYPTYIDKWRNPNRFGQSIIADCDQYVVPGSNKVIKLSEPAEKIVAEVNATIQNDLYKFHFMNTKTDAPESPHGDQRGSATYYALTKHYIPAFGVETSKFLPTTDLKVTYHNLVINAFMKYFGIIPESPALMLDPPVLQYLIVSINNQNPIVIRKDQPLEIAAGDNIKIMHIEANYERGLSLDILGYGDLNDYDQEFKISKNTTLVVRKDNMAFAEIPIKIAGQRPATLKEQPRSDKVEHFIIEHNNRRWLLADGETLPMVEGEKFKILNVLPGFPDASNLKVNFKGYVGDPKNNTGEDRGYLIHTGTDLLKRFAVNKAGDTYEIVAVQDQKTLGKMLIRILPAQVEYLLFKINDQKWVLVKSKEQINLSRDDKFSLEEVQTNLSQKQEIFLQINGQKIKTGEVKRVKDLFPNSSNKQTIEIKNGPMLLGSFVIEIG